MLDIAPPQQQVVQALLRQRLPHVAAVAFGSRVEGWPFGSKAKPYSDLDLALFGLEPADARALAHLRADLDDSALPWRVDLTDARDLPDALRTLVEQRGLLMQGTLRASQTAPNP
jgi:uncharacterized protein